MATRVFLGLLTLVWLPYGLFCFFQPGFLAGAAGITSTSATGTTELRAMYGGLQVAIGLLALSGALRPSAAAPVLWCLALLTAGLGTARLAGAALDGAFSSYNVAALAFELGSVAACLVLLRWGKTAPTAS